MMRLARVIALAISATFAVLAVVEKAVEKWAPKWLEPPR